MQEGMHALTAWQRFKRILKFGQASFGLRKLASLRFAAAPSRGAAVEWQICNKPLVGPNMSQKKNSILSYFSATPQPALQPRGSSCLKDINANIRTPVTSSGSKLGRVQHSTLGKRKVDAAAVIDLDSGGEEQGAHPAKKLSIAKALPANGRKEQLQRALGDDSSKEAKEK